MNYLINNRVIYDSTKGELYTRNEGEVVRLSKTLNRLMLFFVQNSNEILDKESLLLHVWQGNNQVVSDNNLNSNISVLRRYLSSFFDDDMIITIPKVGFKFSALVVVGEGVKSEPQILVNKKKSLINSKIKKNLWGVGILIIAIICTFSVIFFKKRYQNDYASLPVIGTIDKCIIHYINDDYKPDVKKFSLNTLQEKIRDLGINCHFPAKLYYYISPTPMRDGYKGTLFLSYCPELSKDKAAMSCETFYEK